MALINSETDRSRNRMCACIKHGEMYSSWWIKGKYREDLRIVLLRVAVCGLER